MRAELGTDPAVLADDRLLRFLVKENSVGNAYALAAPAADALVRIQHNSAAVPDGQGAGRAGLHTSPFFIAAQTNGGKKLAFIPPVSFDSDGTFRCGMIFLIERRTNQHAIEAAQAFIDPFCF